MDSRQVILLLAFLQPLTLHADPAIFLRPRAPPAAKKSPNTAAATARAAIRPSLQAREGVVRALADTALPTRKSDLSLPYQPQKSKDRAWLAVERRADSTFGLQALDGLQAAIPFYIYEGPAFEFGSACKTRGAYGPVEVAAALYLRRHPWRTKDPARAELFFVPLYASVSISGCGWREEAVQEVLRTAMYRNRNGSDHFSVSQDYSRRKPPSLSRMTLGATFGFEAKASQWNSWLDIASNEVTPYYTGAGCDTSPPPPPPLPSLSTSSRPPSLAPAAAFERWKRRPVPLVFIANCPDDRQEMFVRAVALKHLARAADANTNADANADANTNADADADANADAARGRSSFSSPSPSSPSPAASARARAWNVRLVNQSSSSKLPPAEYQRQLRRARFGLFTRGDTPSSQRLYDLLGLGLLPIIVADGLGAVGLPFSCDVDWAHAAFWVREEDFVRAPVAAVEAVMRLPEEAIRRVFDGAQQARREVMWCADGNRVATNMLRQAYRRIHEQQQQQQQQPSAKGKAGKSKEGEGKAGKDKVGCRFAQGTALHLPYIRPQKQQGQGQGQRQGRQRQTQQTQTQTQQQCRGVAGTRELQGQRWSCGVTCSAVGASERPLVRVRKERRGACAIWDCGRM